MEYYASLIFIVGVGDIKFERFENKSQHLLSEAKYSDWKSVNVTKNILIFPHWIAFIHTM